MLSNAKIKVPKINQDSAWKEILDAYFRECIEFFYTDLSQNINWSVGYQTLGKELQSMTTEAMVGN